MIVTYRSEAYAPERVQVRYVRRCEYCYRWCEAEVDRRYDLRQGYAAPAELPDNVRAAADAAADAIPGYVDWPLEPIGEAER